MLRKLRIPIIIVVTAVLTQAVGLAVLAAVPSAFLPNGNTRYAVAQSTSTELTWSEGWLPLMSQSINLPAGKTADIMVIFCGNGVANDSHTVLQIKVQIAGTVASPGIVNFADVDAAAEGNCFTFYRVGGTAGQVPVRVYWRSSNGTSGYSVNMYQRSMIVIANIH